MVGVASPPSSRSQAVPLPTERRVVGMIYNCSTSLMTSAMSGCVSSSDIGAISLLKLPRKAFDTTAV